MPAADYTPQIQQAAQSWNVDPTLLQALIEQESVYNPKAMSKAGAVGLTQLMPNTAKGMGVTDPSDPTQQIYAGAKYLNEALTAEKTPEAALNYYHGGPSWRDSYGPESAAYAPAVTARYTKLAQAAPPPPSSTPTDDPFTAALKGAQATTSAPPAADPFTAALTQAQKATAPAPTAPNPDAGLNEYGITDDPQQFNKPLTPAEQGVSNVGNAVIQGAKAGFGSAPIGMSPQTEQALVKAGVLNGPGEYSPLKAINHALIGGLAAGGDLAMRTGGALLGAYQGAVSQGGAEIGAPLLGRDLAALPEAFPTGDTTGGTALPHPLSAAPASNPLAREISPAAHDALDAPLPAEFRDNPGVTQPSLVGNTEPNPLAAAAHGGVPLGWTVDDRFGRTQPPPTAPVQSTPVTSAQVQRRDGVGAIEAQRRATAENAAAAQTAAPTPQSVGAAASRDMTAPENMPPETPEQKLTSLGKSVTQSAEDRAGPQLEDHTVYVPGVERPLAARVFSPQNSLDDKTLRATDPAYRAEQEGIERENNQTMVDLLGKDAGDANALKAAHDDRDEVAPPAQKLFANQKPVDASPLLQQIDSTLAGQAGKRGAVVRTLNQVRQSLFDADGNLETLPSQLYGARQNITDLLKKGVGDGADDVRASKPILTGLLDQMDPIINGGAPKYQAYLQQFADASKPINQMEFLQKYQTGAKKLTNVDGYLQLSKVQKMLDDIYQGQSAKGINPAKSLTDEQVQNITNVRNELAAMSLKDRLAKVKGSDTTQQMNRTGILGDGPLGAAVKGAAEMGAHALLFHTTGGIGNAAMAIHRAVIKPAREAARADKVANALTARKAELLSTKPRNPLETP